MECTKCRAEIENDDNFCPKCGHCTTVGYAFFYKDKENIKTIYGEDIKLHNRLGVMFALMVFGVFLFFAMGYIRGNALFKPYIYLKKQISSYFKGYETSIIKANNIYNAIQISTLDDAYDIIRSDFEQQKWQCNSNIEIYRLEKSIEENFEIPSVCLCDMSLEQSQKIYNVISRIYSLFPNIKGSLTNITITSDNISPSSIAYFQPIYQFVNINSDIENYNKVNKTQILLNSYYFLNNELSNEAISNIVGDNWYVKDATWESIIAHEIGHYISFVTLLRDYNLNNVTLVTPDNESIINDVLNVSNSGEHSLKIVSDALHNYNIRHNQNFDMTTFATSISKYANARNENGELIADEIIAEAVHDYFLHGKLASKVSLEIIDVLNSKLR